MPILEIYGLSKLKTILKYCKDENSNLFASHVIHCATAIGFELSREFKADHFQVREQLQQHEYMHESINQRQ